MQNTFNYIRRDKTSCKGDQNRKNGLNVSQISQVHIKTA